MPIRLKNHHWSCEIVISDYALGINWNAVFNAHHQMDVAFSLTQNPKWELLKQLSYFTEALSYWVQAWHGIFTGLTVMAQTEFSLGPIQVIFFCLQLPNMFEAVKWTAQNASTNNLGCQCGSLAISKSDSNLVEISNCDIQNSKNYSKFLTPVLLDLY